jgi:hypothetical protein
LAESGIGFLISKQAISIDKGRLKILNQGFQTTFYIVV